MLPKELIALLTDIFTKALILVGVTAGISFIIAVLMSFIDSQDARAKIIKICSTTVVAVSSAFIIYVLITTIGKYVSPIQYYKKLFDVKTYGPNAGLIIVPNVIGKIKPIAKDFAIEFKGFLR